MCHVLCRCCECLCIPSSNEVSLKVVLMACGCFHEVVICRNLSSKEVHLGKSYLGSPVLLKSLYLSWNSGHPHSRARM